MCFVICKECKSRNAMEGTDRCSKCHPKMGLAEQIKHARKVEKDVR